MSDVIINKVSSLQRCIDRAREELDLAEENFQHDYTRQDAAILNLIRACDTAIDLANYVVRVRKLGVPQSSRDSFTLLVQARIVDPRLGERLAYMTSFRNLAVHEYARLDMDRVEQLIRGGSQDLLAFSDVITSLDWTNE